MWARPGDLLLRAAGAGLRLRHLGPSSPATRPTGGGGAAWRSSPAWATLHLDPWPREEKQLQSFTGVAPPNAGASLGTIPSFSTPGPHKRLPLAPVVAALFPRKSPCLLVWLWTEGVQGASGTQSYSDLHSPPQHLAGTCNAAPIREMNRNPLLPPHRTLPLSNLFGVVPCYLLNLAKNYFPNTFPPCPHQGLN